MLRKNLFLFLLILTTALLAAGCQKSSSSNYPAATNNQNIVSNNYKPYSQDTLLAEQKAGKKVVLFFYAPWCPYCRAADSAFKANSDKIPAGVTVLKTDYDNETALKQKYGVTYQHTFVQIDGSGVLVTKWVSGDIDLLKQNIK